MIGERTKAREYTLLAAVMMPALLVIGYIIIFFHELGHGFTAVALGGYFPFLQLDAEGGRSIYVFAAETQNWKDAFVLLAGALTNFVLALIALGFVVTGVKSRLLRLLVVLVGGLSSLMLVTGTGLLPPWRVRYKEVGQAFDIIGLSFPFQIAIKVLWLLIGVALGVGFFRLLFKELADYFPSRTYKERLLLVTAALGFPVLLLMVVLSVVMLTHGYGEGVVNPDRHMPHIIFMLGGYLLLPFALRSVPPPLSDYMKFTIPRRQVAAWVAACTVFAVVQPVVFGNDRVNPSGLFLSERPPELKVNACNVSVEIDEQKRVKVRLLMRPFGTYHVFLWNRLKDSDPQEWGFYDEFAQQRIPELFPTLKLRITRHYSDPDAEFFSGSWTKGARVVEAECELSEVPFLKDKNDVHLLKLVDFWKTSGIGYIDFLGVKVAENLRVVGTGAEPAGSGVPTLRTGAAAHWENKSYSDSFEVGYVAIKEAPAR